MAPYDPSCMNPDHHQGQTHTEFWDPSYIFSLQGATCQPLESTLPLQHYQAQQVHHLQQASVAQSPTTHTTQSTPSLSFDTSPDPSSDMEGMELDYDILNNLSYLDNFEYDSYNDFSLFSSDESFIKPPFTDADLFPALDLQASPSHLHAHVNSGGMSTNIRNRLNARTAAALSLRSDGAFSMFKQCMAWRRMRTRSSVICANIATSGRTRSRGI
ncbi:hypothetical protein AYO20_02171 [Fonsecaea nubica]|uniref:Uncharacterized protein n=1 Tax=Fonsecaea nubica TaxID=856822 RepID=A0A178DA90_9EURO|nr:hypothetical protein AYO20_02171 [Fonsecaea nubica]OAL38522.1 hypothetical protein AYO20_02171 [Fonsecaea nubica]